MIEDLHPAFNLQTKTASTQSRPFLRLKDTFFDQKFKKKSISKIQELALDVNFKEPEALVFRSSSKFVPGFIIRAANNNNKNIALSLSLKAYLQEQRYTKYISRQGVLTFLQKQQQRV